MVHRRGGATFGSPCAPVAGALARRVTRDWSVPGTGEPYTLLSYNLRERIPWGPARAAVAGLADILATGPALDPAR